MASNSGVFASPGNSQTPLIWIRILYKSSNGRGILGPDDSFSVQQVLNHLHAVAYLSLNMLGHRKDSATNLARLNIFEWRDSSRPSAFAFFMTCHGSPLLNHP